MQSLLGGADCSTSSNPLKQVLQREGVDNSLFKDRLSGPSVSNNGGQSAFRPTLQPGAVPTNGLHANPTPHPFNLSHLSAALSQDNVQSHHQFDAQWNQARQNGFHPAPRQQWQLSQSQPQIQQAGPAPAWLGDFQHFSQSQEQSSGKGKGRANELSPEYNQARPTGNGYSNYPQMQICPPYQPSFQPMYNNGNGLLQQQQPVMTNANGQDQMSQKEMDELFARAEEDWKAADVASASKPQVDTRSEYKEDGEQEVEGDTTIDAKGDFEKVWESLRPEAERLGELAQWEKDFSQFTNDEDDLFDVLNESLNREDVGQTNFDDQFGEMGLGGESYEVFESDDGVPSLRPYEFATSNPYDRLEASTAWEEAQRLLSTGGPLSDAAMMIESFIARSTGHTQSGVSAVEAWSTLGRVHAMDEKEDKALSAFEQGRRALENNVHERSLSETTEEAERVKGATGEMLTNLAISYVNESLDLAALTTLHQFLRLLHPSHAGAAPSKSSMSMSLGEGTSPWALHRTMTDSFLALARGQWQLKGVVDPDVQVGLGTLYYMMGEYGEARDCWVAALGERPDDYLLWNRLGATLANGGNSEEAVDAYRRALELKPTFTRAIFNLGVACLNIGVHREAAEHFLAALSLHSAHRSDPTKGESDDSGSLWSTLRRSLNALDMRDLANLAKPGTDLSVFRQAGFDF